jgi:hypothetical protein
MSQSIGLIFMNCGVVCTPELQHCAADCTQNCLTHSRQYVCPTLVYRSRCYEVLRVLQRSQPQYLLMGIVFR